MNTQNLIPTTPTQLNPLATMRLYDGNAKIELFADVAWAASTIINPTINEQQQAGGSPVVAVDLSMLACNFCTN